MAKSSITFTFIFPWWAIAYARAVLFFAETFGMQPDADKLARRLIRAARIKQIPG